jgi:hypothetical protein
MNDETCPKCGAHFPADLAWESLSLIGLAFAPGWQNLAARVKCPTCGTVFPAREFRYFGFVSPSAMRVAVLGGMAAMIIFGAIFYFSAP